MIVVDFYHWPKCGDFRFDGSGISRILKRWLTSFGNTGWS